MPIPIDLSDFDPYSPTASTSSTSNREPTSDPLNWFKQLQLSDTPTTQPGNQSNLAVTAQDERHSQFLLDHSSNRQPFHSPPLPSHIPSTAPTLPPPIPLPIPSTSTVIHSHSHPVRPGRSQSGFSPPRRLSSLMNDEFPSHSPPSPSFTSLDPFHPFPSPSSNSASQNQKKGRSRERSISNELYWGEFQTATPSLTPSPRATPPPPSPRTKPPSHPHPQRAATSPNPRDYHLKNLPPPPSSNPVFDPFNQPVKLVGLRSGTTQILSETIAEGIRPALPPRLRISPKWTLLYSLDQHGTSLQSLFSCISSGLARGSGGGFVLCVKTEKGRVFGGYVSEEFRNDESGIIGGKRGGRSVVTGNRVWGGDGSSFLFTTLPLPPSDPRLSPLIKTYPPTYRNTYFQHSSLSSGIALGGGNDGKFGIWIDERLERGWTGESETFGNRPLTEMGDGLSFGEEDEEDGEDRGKFEVVGLEAWAVGS